MEQHVYEYVPESLQTQIRSKILDSVNDLADIAIDLVKSDTGQINEFWVDELAELKDMIRHG
jgi:hypothetical protein